MFCIYSVAAPLCRVYLRFWIPVRDKPCRVVVLISNGGKRAMIKHVVMWKFKDGVAEADKLEMKRRLEALMGVVPTLRGIEVGMDVSGKTAAMDMVLCTEFQSLEDLQAYAVHPEHRKVVGFVKPLVCDRAVVDYGV